MNYSEKSGIPTIASPSWFNEEGIWACWPSIWPLSDGRYMCITHWKQHINQNTISLNCKSVGTLYPMFLFPIYHQKKRIYTFSKHCNAFYNSVCKRRRRQSEPLDTSFLKKFHLFCNDVPLYELECWRPFRYLYMEMGSLFFLNFLKW